MAAYDTARMTKGEAIKVMERLGELKSSMYRAVLPGEWDYETIETILRSNATSAEQTAMLCEVCPLGEHLDLQQSSPTPRTVPFGVEALASLGIFKASIDLWHQYDLRTGKPIGHLFDACRRLSNWLQMSKASGVGFVTIAIKVQMSLHALDDDTTTRPLIDRLWSLITAVKEVDKKYRSGATAELTKDECLVAAAATALVDAEPDMDPKQINAILGPLMTSCGQQAEAGAWTAVSSKKKTTSLVGATSTLATRSAPPPSSSAPQTGGRPRHIRGQKKKGPKRPQSDDTAVPCGTSPRS